jgi:hypothetical protein
MGIVSAATIRLAALLLAVLIPGAASGAVSIPHSYEEASTGYFRDLDTVPGAYRLYLQSPESRGGFWGLGPGETELKRSSFAADAHAGVRHYLPRRSCESCHEAQRYSLHSSRGGVSCVQCHRSEPIAGIHHYYSAMNPIRRHAYVCAKCHEGATASFATYVVHEPPPLAQSTEGEFPLFYYATWFMMILAGGVFIIFIPYVTLWGFRELVGLLSRKQSHG